MESGQGEFIEGEAWFLTLEDIALIYCIYSFTGILKVTGEFLSILSDVN